MSIDNHHSLVEAIPGWNAERDWKSLFDASHEGYVVEYQNRVVHVNQRLLEMFGRPRESVIGSPWTTLVDYSELSRVEQLQSGNEPIVCHGRTPDRQLFPIQVICRDVSVGEQSVRVFRLMDISHLRRTESTLRITERRFRQLCEGLPLGVMQLDEMGRCRYCNRQWEQMTGVHAHMSGERSWINSIVAEDQSRIS